MLIFCVRCKAFSILSQEVVVADEAKGVVGVGVDERVKSLEEVLTNTQSSINNKKPQ